jgi:hypothetical protein
MTAYSPTLVQTYQYKAVGLNELYGSQSHPPHLEMVQVIHTCVFLIIQVRQLYQINKTEFILSNNVGLLFWCLTPLSTIFKFY